MEAITDYLVGAPVQDILINHDISKTTLYRHLKKAGIPKREDLHFPPLTSVQIKLDYESGSIINELAERYGGTYFTISKTLKSLGVQPRKPSESARKYTDDDIDLAIKKYRSGSPAHECGPSEATVLRWLKGRNIPARRQPDYSGNPNFFKSLDNNLALYWFGFLCADGSICKKKYVEINLQTRDWEHLEMFGKHLEYTKPIKETEHYIKERGKWYKSANLLFGCVEAVRDLRNLGLPEIKNGDFSPLTLLDNEQFRTFLLGYFDGDGSIYNVKPKNKPNCWRWYICGPHRHILEYMLARCPVVKRHNAVWSGTVWRVQYGGNQIVPKIVRWLYNEQDVFLDRKRKLSLKAMGQS